MVALDSIIEHVHELQELKNELLVINTNINDKEFITILFNILQYVYHNFVTSFYVSSRNQIPTFEEVVGLLL
jgi:hypothetical protein